MFFANLTAIQKGMVLILVPVLFELVLLAVLTGNILFAESRLREIDFSRDSILKLQSFENKMAIAMLTIINDDEGTKKQLEAVAKVDNLLDSAQGFLTLTKHQNSDLSGITDKFQKLETNMRKLAKSAEAVLSDPDIPVHMRAYHVPRVELLQTIRELLSFIKEVVKIETSTAGAEPAQIESIRLTLITTLGSGVLLSFAISAVLAGLFTNDIARRVTRLTREAQGLAAGKTLNKPESGADEIARLEENLYQASLKLTQWRQRELAILDNAADIICSLDDKFRFIRINAAAQTVWQYAPEDLLGKSLLTLVEAEQNAPLRTALQRLTEQLGTGTIESRILCGDGRHKDTLWRVKWSHDDNSYFCVVRDITAARKLEQLRQRLLAVACHDLRSPIMSVAISLELMMKEVQEKLPETIKVELSAAREDCARLTALTDKFLLLEKLESGTSAMSLTMVSLEDACLVALERLEGRHLDKDIRILLPENDALVLAEEEKLVLAIFNLLDNAIKVSPPGSKVALVVDDNQKAKAMLSVFDQGSPLDNASLVSVFERFRANTKDSQTDSGLDLSLAVTRAIVQAHGGNVGAESLPDGGNRFWLSLPRYKDGEEA